MNEREKRGPRVDAYIAGRGGSEKAMEGLMATRALRVLTSVIDYTGRRVWLCAGLTVTGGMPEAAGTRATVLFRYA